ncbi:permease [Oenococcus oeni]|nr:permease [Oenococcus oeni]
MEIVSLLLIGLIIGFVVISMGGGGAAIYLGVLTAVFHLAPAAATATSLVTALPSLILGSLGYYRQRAINFKLGNQMLIAALPAVVVGSLLSPYIPESIYTWVVGIILVLLGLNIMRNKQTGSTQLQAHGRLKASSFGILSGLMVGVAGLSGGGPILAGLLILGLNMVNAVATSSYVLVGMTIVGAIFHTAGGQVDWHAGLGLMIGALIGAAIAPYVMSRFVGGSKNAGGKLKPIMGILLILTGIKTIW